MQCRTVEAAVLMTLHDAWPSLPHAPPSCNSILAIPPSSLMDYQSLRVQMLTAPISYKQKKLQIEISFPLPEWLATHRLLAVVIG